MTAPEALKLAVTWVAAGEKGVLVENPDTGDVWTPEAFRVVAGEARTKVLFPTVWLLT